MITLLERLNRNHIELYQLHNRIDDKEIKNSFSVKEIIERKGVLYSLEKLKSEGRIKNIGITALGSVDPIKEVIKTGAFDTAQVYYNLLNPSAKFDKASGWNDHDFSGIINECKKYDMGIMCIRVFASGFLATDTRHGREIPVTHGINDTEQNRRIKKIFHLLKDIKGTKAQTSLRYGLSNDSLSCIVVGLSKIDHLKEIIDAVKLGPLNYEILEKIEVLQKSNFA